MATKLDYLKDVREHLHSTGGEAAARLDVSEATVLEAYRRARRQGLIEGDGGRPEKFVLTDAGVTQLRVLAGEGNPAPSLPANIEGKFSALEEKVNDTIEDVKGLFGLVDRVLSTRRSEFSPAQQSDDAAIVEQLLAEKSEVEEKLGRTSRAVEYYATQIAAVRFLDCREMLKSRADQLSQQLDSEMQESVRRLIELEEGLGKERNRFFGSDKDKVREIQDEIAKVREALGFAVVEYREVPDSE